MAVVVVCVNFIFFKGIFSFPLAHGEIGRLLGYITVAGSKWPSSWLPCSGRLEVATFLAVLQWPVRSGHLFGYLTVAVW